MAQSAYSKDINKINQELIESVKFRFLQKDISGKGYSSKADGSLLGLEDIQDRNNTALYTSIEELIFLLSL